MSLLSGFTQPNTHDAILLFLHQISGPAPTCVIDGTQLILLSAAWFLSDIKLSQHATAALKSLHQLLLQLGIDWKILLLYLVTQLSINRSQTALWLAQGELKDWRATGYLRKWARSLPCSGRMHGSPYSQVTWEFSNIDLPLGPKWGTPAGYKMENI